MSEEDQSPHATFSTEYFNDEGKPENDIIKTATLSITFNLDDLTNNPHGTILVRGFLEERKIEILRAIMEKRKAKRASNLIVPMTGKAPLNLM